MNLGTRSFLFVAVALAVTCTASAQMRIAAVVHAGLNIANASLDPDVGQIDASGATHSSRLGLVAGAGLEYAFTNLFNLQLEADYAQRGITIDYPDLGNLGPATGSLLYERLEIPLLFKFKFGPIPWTFSAYAGPDLALKLKASGTFTGADSSFTLSHDSYVEDIAWSIDLGASAAYEFTPGISAVLDLRYVYGISDVTVPVDRGEELWYTRDLRIIGGLRCHIWSADR